LTKITWTIEPIGFNRLNLTGKPCKIGPVVPAIVAMVTDPSIPSNGPVPLLFVTIQFNSIQKKESDREKESRRDEEL